MTLFFSPGACSLAPHIVAYELGMTIEVVKVNLKDKKCADGSDYTKVNPKGYVPALKLDSGELLTEGPAIMQYMADQQSESRLVPKAGTFERAKLHEWLNFISTEVHKGFSPLWHIESMVPNKEGGEQLKTFIQERLNKHLAMIDEHLQTHTFLMGSDFTVADAYLFTVLRWAPHLKIDLVRFPNVDQYVGRVSQRPKVKEAMKAEGLLKTT